MTELIKEKTADTFTLQHERSVTEAMFKTVLGHRGPGYEITREQAMDLALADAGGP